MKLFAALLSASLILPVERLAQSPPAPTSEEYAVYTQVVRHRSGPKGERRFVVVSETAPAGPFGGFDSTTVLFLQEQLTKRQPPVSLEPELAEEYRALSTEPVQLAPDVLPVPLATVVSRAELDAAFDRPAGGWQGFRERFPGTDGYLRFSRVAFDAAGTHALLFVEHGCGGLCGTGTYVLLHKSKGQWRLVAEVMVWIA